MRECFFCGATQRLERHHIFGGANRKKSDKDGLVVDLCHECHNEPPYGVHHNKEMMLELHQYGERLWLEQHDATIEDFIKAYGKNYL